MRKYIQENIIVIGLIATLIIGTILRFKGLTFQSYWLDELFSAYVSMPNRDFLEVYDITSTDVVHPPLYTSILWVWYHIFGFTEFTGRSFSAVIGSLGIFTVYLLGKELFNREVGLYAAIISSTNQFLIYYSQETRSNSLLFLLSTISYIYFLRILNDYNKKDFVLYLFFTIALIYTHFFGLVLVATQVFIFIYYFIKDKENRKLLVTLSSITSVILLLSLLPLLDQIMSSSQIDKIWMKEPTVWFVLEYMRKYVQSQYLISIFFLTISFGVIHLVKNEHKTYRVASIVLLLWIIMGYLLPYLRSITSAPLLHPRSTIIMIPPLIIFLSYSIYLMKDTTLKVVTVSTIMLFSIYHLHYANYYGKVIKEQFREVLLEVNKSKVKLPAFDIIYSGTNYKTYARMLSIETKNISNSTNLNAQYTKNTLPKCFFILDAHGDHISTNKTLQDEKIIKVLEIKKRDARGVLYAYNVPSQLCSELYHGILQPKIQPLVSR